jgi:hypothetical protein
MKPIKMAQLLTSPVLFLVLGILACGSVQQAATPAPTASPTPLPTEYSTISELNNDCKDLAAQRRLARITGQIILPLPSTTCDVSSCSLMLTQDYSSSGSYASDKTMYLDVTLGAGMNRMEPLPDPYTPADLRLHTADEQIASDHSQGTVVLRASDLYGQCNFKLSTIRLPCLTRMN